MKFPLSFLIFLLAFFPLQSQWRNLTTNSTASLRGLAAVSKKVCWASGSEGTVLRTTDGGETFRNVPPSYEKYKTLQFRDIHAFDQNSALIISAGLPAVILKTKNGGKTWTETYRNETQGVFFDAMDFWDSKRGMAFSDAPDDKLFIIETKDGGNSWQPLPDSNLPTVFEKQGGFAASGTCLKTFGESSVIIGLGNQAATVLISNDFGKSWETWYTTLDFGAPSKGIFSFDFKNENEGICVGGDYRADSLSKNTIAQTADGGRSWQLISHPAVSGKYRSCVKYLSDNEIVAVSRTGTSFSKNNGKTWALLKGAFYTLSLAEDGTLWASGAEGKMAVWDFQKK